MISNLSRRRVLQTTSVGVGGILAGCSRLNPLGCADHKAVVIQVESVTTTPENPLDISELPADQQPFLQQAIEDGEYRKCPFTDVENKGALNELSSTIAERANSADDDPVYLEYQGKYYAIITFRIEDQVYA